jgi:hypothetical protein
MAPAGVPLTAESLATVRSATMIHKAELELRKSLRTQQAQRLPGDWSVKPELASQVRRRSTAR